MILFCLLLLLVLPVAAQGAQPSSLEITSDPPGAMVVLDRTILGHTPLKIYPLRPGTHHLRVSAGENYRPYIEEEYEAVAGKAARLDLQLEPSTALLLEQGRAAVQRQQLKAALPLLQRATEGLPRQPEALWWLGQIYLIWGQLDDSLLVLRDYANFAPYRPDLYLCLGLVHELQGRPADAVTAYKLALLKTESLKSSLDGLSTNPTWEEIKELEPTDAREHLRKGQLLSLKGQMEPALAEMKEAVRLTFGDWRPQLPRAEIQPLSGWKYPPPEDATP